MKTSTVACVLMLVAAVALVAAPAFAAPISMKDSADFNVKAFEGDVVSPTSVWTLEILNEDDVEVSTDGSVVTWTTEGVGQIMWKAGESTEWGLADTGTGFTFEICAKINSQASSGTTLGKGPFAFLMAADSGRYDGYVSSTNFQQRQRVDDDDDVYLNEMVAGDDFTDGYHTFRVAREADYMDEGVLVDGKAYYYVDDELVSDPDGVIGLEQLTETLMRFGDPSTGAYNGSVSVDYARFDTTGAYAPVPEPSTIALLVTGLIGLLAYAWRKRK